MKPTIQEDNFVWGFKGHVFKRRILYAAYKVGGLDMVNLEHYFNSLLLSWIYRLHQNIHWYKLFFNDLTDMLLWKCNLHLSDLSHVKIEVLS